MNFDRPRKDSQRLVFLERLTDQATQDVEEGHPLLEEALLARARRTREVFTALQKKAAQLVAARKEAVARKNKAVDKLIRTIRDFQSALERRTIREDHPPAVSSWFRWPGGRVNATREQEMPVMADLLISGDGKAIAAGYPPMANPSAGDLALRKAEAERALKRVSGISRDYAALKDGLAEQRSEVAELFLAVKHYLRYKLAGETPAVRRKTMRRYGFQSIRAKGTTADVPAQHDDADI